MSADANSLIAPVHDGIELVVPEPRRRRIVPPDPEMLMALWKGVWSTFITVFTLSGLLFACAQEDPPAKPRQAVSRDG
ncbi:hypothetical protein HNO88_002514 [Novosphingobium chloroacetimidivorans]|uniref:Uncharacterized protein n=1 Tax=Novosphingobium chloroacetimidivorans TaxID=1428314 RepID=A0A7W7KAU5_9SPHN|nr:hypothetical protein [Novosphingobium chloroacetimidivorans]MBB4859185.1 hypothetical protein [Novosphingobium chloroacetimidivorans]